MNIFNFENIELAYELTESFNKKQNYSDEITNYLIFIHGGIIANANLPLVTRSDILTQNYKILHYHRRGYGISSHRNTDISIVEQARDCIKLLDYLRIKKAHIVGHSIGGAIAIEFAHRYKNYVKSLILLEPAITGYNQYTNLNVLKEFEPMIERYDKGYRKSVITNFMKITIGKNFKKIIQNVLPENSYNMCLIDAKTFFHDEIKAMKSWNFTKKHAKNLTEIPLLHIFGKRKDSNIIKERNKFLLKLLPNTISYSLEDAPHMLQMTNYNEVSEIINSFLSKI